MSRGVRPGKKPGGGMPLNELRNSRTIASCSETGVGRVTVTVISLVRIFLARLAYLSELSVSSNWSWEGETLVIIVVRQLPPRESLSSRVSFESR